MKKKTKNIREYNFPYNTNIANFVCLWKTWMHQYIFHPDFKHIIEHTEMPWKDYNLSLSHFPNLNATKTWLQNQNKHQGNKKSWFRTEMV